MILKKYSGCNFGMCTTQRNMAATLITKYRDRISFICDLEVFVPFTLLDLGQKVFIFSS